MTRALLLVSGAIALALLWLGPLPALAPRFFSAHMTMHMGVVAVAAPLMAMGLAGTPWDPARRWPPIFSAIPASVVELIVVWSWHAPALHHFARGSATGLFLEQGTFVLSSFAVWMSAFGGEPSRRSARAGLGVVALLLTSMHMTLLGALIALAPRALYRHEVPVLSSQAALDEQHLGGAIMLIVGGVSYLAGGLWLAALLLRRAAASQPLTHRTVV